jgi:hypothetical protein
LSILVRSVIRTLESESVSLGFRLPVDLSHMSYHHNFFFLLVRASCHSYLSSLSLIVRYISSGTILWPTCDHKNKARVIRVTSRRSQSSLAPMRSHRFPSPTKEAWYDVARAPAVLHPLAFDSPMPAAWTPELLNFPPQIVDWHQLSDSSSRKL